MRLNFLGEFCQLGVLAHIYPCLSPTFKPMYSQNIYFVYVHLFVQTSVHWSGMHRETHGLSFKRIPLEHDKWIRLFWKGCKIRLPHFLGQINGWSNTFYCSLWIFSPTLSSSYANPTNTKTTISRLTALLHSKAQETSRKKANAICRSTVVPFV